MKHPALLLSGVVRRWPVPVVLLTMAAAIVLAFGIPRLKFQNGQETLLDPGSKISRDNTRFQQEFGGDPMLVLFETSTGVTIDRLFTPENRAELDRLQRALEDSGRYESIITPLLILELARTQVQQRMIEQPVKLARDQDEAAASALAASAVRGETAEQQAAAADAARQQVLDAFNDEFGEDARRFVAVGEQDFDNPAFIRFLMYGADGAIRPELTGIFPDDRHALMVVRLKGNLSIDESSKLAAELVDEAEAYQFDGVTKIVSGTPLLIKEINDEMRQSMIVMAVFAVVIMVAVLSLIFRARWRLLSLPAVLVGCVSAFGLMGFVGIPLTMVTISGLPILIGLGVDFAIQAHSRIEEETRVTGSAEHAIDRTFLRLGPALVIAVIAAGVGFLVLHLSDVPMIRDFGSMLAVGSMIVFMTSIGLISSIVYLRERVRLGDQQSHSRFEVERVVNSLTSRTIGRIAPIAAVALLVAIGGLWMSRGIGTETDPEKFVPSSSDVLRDLHRVRDVTGSTSELSLLIETSGGDKVTDQEIISWLGSFEARQQEQHPQLTRSNSIASLTSSLTGGAPTSEAALLALDTLPDALVASVVNDDLTMASITFPISGNQSLDERKAMTEAIEADAGAPAGVTVAPAGIAVVGTASVDALSANRDLMSFVAIGAIFVILMGAYRNPVKAIAPLLPVVLALGGSAMILYASGTQYSPLTSISGPLIIAMGTEFNVLLMSRYFEERSMGLEPRAAMSKASLSIGRAIMASGLTVMGGFAVLAFTNFPLLDNFGKVTALNIGISLISTLVLLPPLLVWADEDRGLISAPSPDALAPPLGTKR